VVTEGNGAIVAGSYLRVEAPPGQIPFVRPSTRAGDTGAMIAAYDTDEGRQYVGAFPLREGDRLCLNRCARAGALWSTFRAEGRFDPEGGPEGEAFDTASGAQRPVQRLSQYFCARGPSGACREPALADPVARGGDRYPALSFVFEHGGEWSLVLLDPGARLMRGGTVAVAGARAFGLERTLPLETKASRRFAILALRDRSLQERRSFVLTNDTLIRDKKERRSIRLALDTPEQLPMGNCADPLTRLAPAPNPADLGSIIPESVGRRPGSFLTSAADGFSILPKAMCRGVSHVIQAPAESAAASGLSRRMEFRVDRMGAPLLLLAIAISAAIIFHLASSRLWLTDRLDSVIFALAQYLVTVRAIIGIEAVFVDPGLDWRVVYADVGVAMVAVPAILLAARRRADLDFVTLTSVAGFAAAAFAALWWWLGALESSVLVIMAATLAILALRAVQRLAAAAPGEDRRGWLQAGPGFWPWLLTAIVVGRFLLALLDFKERVAGIAISAVYVPALVIAVAGLLAQAEAERGRQARTAALFLVALFVGLGVVGLAIRDVGFAIAHLPPIAGVALWRYLQWRRQKAEAPGRAGLVFAAPAALLAAGYVLLFVLINLTSPPPETAPLQDRVAYSTRALNLDANVLRLRAVFAPGQIPRIANNSAAEQLDQSALLGGMTDTLAGRGYMAPIRLGSFRTNAAHISDYVAAAHIMAPFGRLGAAALLAVIGFAAAAACAGGRTAFPAGWPQLAGALAIWTMFGLAAYMILSNLLLVPFTGRNIYLLAPASGGDLVEALALLTIARVGLAARKPA
jgi:hypothetical protein